MHSIVFCYLSYNIKILCGHRIMAITPAFQADNAGSIPAARSNYSYY